MEEIKKVIKDTLKGSKWGEPIASYKITFDSQQAQLEPIYYWLLDFINDAGWESKKIIDNFMSSPGSGHFSEMGQKLIEEGLRLFKAEVDNLNNMSEEDKEKRWKEKVEENKRKSKEELEAYISKRKAEEEIKDREKKEMECDFCKGAKTIECPINHGEGRFVPANPDVLKQIYKKDLVVFKYAGKGKNKNPNA